MGSARWRTVELPSRGQQNCPAVARCSARSSVGQWRHPLAGGGLGEADAVAGIWIDWPDGHGWNKFSAERGNWVLLDENKSVIDEGEWRLAEQTESTES